MHEHPILFSGPMVLAILQGRKSQTRRVANPQPAVSSDGYACGPIRCPYGAPGDLLWVRETWCTRKCFNCDVGYDDERCTCSNPPLYRATEPDAVRADDEPWRPSIFMPRWASRITLRVTGVRVERVQGISNVDAIAEGAMEWAAEQETPVRDLTCSDARLVFLQLWDSINAKRGFGWEANPWVWVVAFERVDRRTAT
jgi:hypothetical protein